MLTTALTALISAVLGWLVPQPSVLFAKVLAWFKARKAKKI